jgi:hypothetical protein
MFKDIQRGLEKFFTKERVLVIIVFLIFAWVLFSYSGSKSHMYDGMYSNNSHQNMYANNNHQTSQQQMGMASNPVVADQTPVLNAMSAPSNIIPPSNNDSHPVAHPGDLLPVDQNSQWSALNPNTMNQGSVLMPDLLQAGYHIGLDTIGQTLRNANLQLRSDPVIPKQNIGPWLQSTIEPDLGRVPLELGVGPQ